MTDKPTDEEIIMLAVELGVSVRTGKGAVKLTRAALEKWGTPQPAPATQQPEGDVVAYLDVGASGYLDLGAALSEDALQQLPKGRHALVIAGTYGIDGYVAAPQPSPMAQAVAEPMMDEQIQDLLLCGNPTDEEMRLIRMGWVVVRPPGGQHVE